MLARGYCEVLLKETLANLFYVFLRERVLFEFIGSDEQYLIELERLCRRTQVRYITENAHLIKLTRLRYFR